MSKKPHYRKLKVKGRLIDEHRYVMEQYLGRRLDRREVVHHLNGDIHDNRIENLELMDSKAHARLHFANKRGKIWGQRTGSARFKDREIVDIMERLDRGESVKSIADHYKVGRRHIEKLRHRDIWRHITAIWPLRVQFMPGPQRPAA